MSAILCFGLCDLDNGDLDCAAATTCQTRTELVNNRGTADVTDDLEDELTYCLP